jgi:hypothetical protein
MHAALGNANQDRLLTEAQAADYLQLSIRTLQAWRVKGAGPLFVKAGRIIRYRRYDLLVWVKNQTVQSTHQKIEHRG